jgi:hypothetical protein
LHNFEEVIKDFTSKYPIKWIDNYCDNVSWNTYTWKQTRDSVLFTNLHQNWPG